MSRRVHRRCDGRARSDADKGYQAASTLAGTRLRTDLRDVGAAISVVTAQFLADTASTNARDLLVYTTNTEIGGFEGNFSGVSTGNGFSNAWVSDVSRPFYGSDDLKFDAWLRYGRRIFSDKIRWSIQLNVRDLLADDDLIAVTAQPNGQVASARIPQPNKWTLTNTFSF